MKSKYFENGSAEYFDERHSESTKKDFKEDIKELDISEILKEERYTKPKSSKKEDIRKVDISEDVSKEEKYIKTDVKVKIVEYEIKD